MRRLITKTTPQDLNKSLLTLDHMVNNDLNISYDYTAISKAYTTYEYYFNQLMEAMGAEYRMKVQLSFTHNNFIRVNLVSNNNPLDKAHLDVVNEPLRFATEMFLSFEEELRDLYDDYYNQYNSTYSSHLTSIENYTNLYNELVNTLTDLEQQAIEAEVSTADITEAERAGITEANEVVEGYGKSLDEMLNEIENATKSEEQEKAEEAAYYAGKDSDAEFRGAAAVTYAETLWLATNDELGKATAAATEAREALDNALQSYRDSATEFQVASTTSTGAAAATSMAAGGTLPDAGETKTVTWDTGFTTTVHNNGDGTYTVSTTSPSGISSTRQYDEEDLENGHAYNQAQTATNAARENMDAKEAEYENAKSNLQEKANEYYDAKAMADDAKSNLDNISDLYDTPMSSGDELDNWAYTGDGEGVAETDESIVNDFDFGDE